MPSPETGRKKRKGVKKRIRPASDALRRDLCECCFLPDRRHRLQSLYRFQDFCLSGGVEKTYDIHLPLEADPGGRPDRPSWEPSVSEAGSECRATPAVSRDSLKDTSVGAIVCLNHPICRTSARREERRGRGLSEKVTQPVEASCRSPSSRQRRSASVRPAPRWAKKDPKLYNEPV